LPSPGPSTAASQGPWPGWARSPPSPASPWASTWSPRRPGRQAARRGLGNRATAGTSGRAAAGPGRGDHQLRPGALVNILFAGVTFILYGLAVAWSQLYPRWRGWVVVRAGLGLIAAGLIQASAGEATTVTRTLTIIFPTITPWLTQMGTLAFRRATSTEGAIAGELESGRPGPPFWTRPPVPPIKERRLGSSTTHDEHRRHRQRPPRHAPHPVRSQAQVSCG
jgi:hypothetical protein